MSSISILNPELKNWLKEFQKKRGRPLRVLHIGNIAGNAYSNAKLQRRIGIDAYLIEDQDKYIMSQPEWEDADFEGDWGDHFQPNWENIDLKGYKRPDWVITGDLVSCFVKIENMFSENKNNIKIYLIKHIILSILAFVTIVITSFLVSSIKIFCKILFNVLCVLREIFISIIKHMSLIGYECGEIIRSFLATIVIMMVNSSPYVSPLIREKLYRHFKKEALHKIHKFLIQTGFDRKKKKKNTIKNTILRLYQKTTNFNFNFPKLSEKIYSFENSILKYLRLRGTRKSHKRYKNLIKEFQKFFPERVDQLTYLDILPYTPMSEIWEKIFVYFDIVQCYGGHPMWGALTGYKNYVALEHGTLRDFPFEDGPYQRLVALGYRKALHTFITNGDCISKAKELGLKKYTPMIHPTDIKPFREVTNSKIKEIRLRYKAEILLVSPMRHDWEVKGNDLIIRALPTILERTHKTVALVLCEWGQEIDRSKKLIKDLNLEQNIHWIRPLPKIRLAQYFNAADVVLDQMILPCFGGIVPQSLSSGTPVIMSYDPQSTAWMFPEPAPVLPAFTSADITSQVIKALNPKWRKDFKEKAKKWVDTYHSPEFLMNGHLPIYKKIIESAILQRKK